MHALMAPPTSMSLDDCQLPLVLPAPAPKALQAEDPLTFSPFSESLRVLQLTYWFSHCGPAALRLCPRERDCAPMRPQGAEAEIAWVVCAWT